jgi:hypothetical protein
MVEELVDVIEVLSVHDGSDLRKGRHRSRVHKRPLVRRDSGFLFFFFLPFLRRRLRLQSFLHYRFRVFICKQVHIVATNFDITTA